MRLGKLAESFDALKKKERIKTMLMAVEEDFKPEEIAEETDMSTSTIRNYLKELEDADIIYGVMEGYEYTDHGQKLRASIELFGYEEEVKWLKQKQKRVESLRDEMKSHRKQLVKQKILSLV